MSNTLTFQKPTGNIRGPYRKPPPDNAIIYAQIPENFDSASHIKAFPLPEGVTKDNIYYFFDLIMRLPTINYDFIDADGFVSLSSKKMERNFPGYKRILDYMLDSRLLLCRPWYKVGIQTKGYKIFQTYSTGNIRPVLITEPAVKRIIWAERCPKQNHAYTFFLQSLAGIEINEEALRRFIEVDYDKKNRDPQLVEEKKKKFKQPDGSHVWKYTPVDITSQKQSGLMLLSEMLESKQSGMGLRTSVDTAGGRFHHPISRMKKEHRNTLSWKGQKIVGYDIGCSQFFLMTRLFDLDFWQGAPTNGKVVLSNLPERFILDFINTQSSTNKKKNLSAHKNLLESIISVLQKFVTGNSEHLFNVNSYTLHKSGNTTESILLNEFFSLSMFLKCRDEALVNKLVNKLQEEAEQFSKLTSRGTLYEGYQDLVLATTGRSIDRRQAKDSMCQTLFSSNSFYRQPEAEAKREFSKVFPAIMEFVKLLKTGMRSEDPHARLPKLLQAIEAEIILNRIGSGIERERPEMPLIPLHDGLFTIDKHANYLTGVMEEELFKAIGRRPTIRQEEWSLENLHYRDGEQFLREEKVA